jgi:hypothetical protein
MRWHFDAIRYGRPQVSIIRHILLYAKDSDRLISISNTLWSHLSQRKKGIQSLGALPDPHKVNSLTVITGVSSDIEVLTSRQLGPTNQQAWRSAALYAFLYQSCKVMSQLMSRRL